MADVIDNGCETATQFTEMALARHRATSRQPQQQSAAECEECGDIIPTARQLAVPGCQCCVLCQQIKE
ncbi:TraR/DksA family transcriptional regulator [Photobacterium phosphoreum]|uniref:TraR/DksA family transcriptional regulator n=1 Tax=Photobacterium phosphoreum TaxID=659 RepID=A0AAW4ZX86_PHOPO|nr:TraR/DksA C4-type zinc finger protein [Photobacterium phosphoreum]MCD9491066.1 TraR/DksA family transcriptional regulator [Photobacterium phosphoreum]MCF2190324.1 TraR/DksA family transcriptional regulator [Photobacterium phosphoreum]MCF2300911.1 TraR/DksA family transcriptional regulator [Photobacterium phosphoreum]